MTRVLLLVAGLIVFSSCSAGLRQGRAVSPGWRAALAGISLAGMLLAVSALLAAVILPEVLVVSSLHEVWELCQEAFHDVGAHPVSRLPSMLAAAGLGLVLGRGAWSLAASSRRSRRARLRGTEPIGLVARRAPVFLVPVEVPTAYSVGGVRGQVVVSRALLDMLDRAERQAVLFHEEAHLRRRHHLVLALARAAAAGLVFFPPARWALSELEQALEEAADDYAAERIGDAAVVASGLSKAALAGLRNPVGAVALGDGLDVGARIRRLLEPVPRPRWLPIGLVGASVVLLVFLAMSQAMATVAAVAATHHVVGLGTAVLCPLGKA